MEMSSKVACLVLALLPLGCAPRPALGPGSTEGGARSTPSSATAASQAAPAPLAPLVDYHKHLRGPLATQLQAPPFLPPVGVPEELATLLGERAKRWNDKSALAELYTEDAVLHDNRVRAWYKGPSSIASFVLTRFRAGYHVTPVAFDFGQSRGYVAGYYTRYERGDTTHFMQAHLSLEKGGDGAWRIAAETFTYPGPEILTPITAEQLVEELDEAGIQRAVVLSPAYWFGSAFRDPLPDEYEKVRAENDWNAQQAARFPDRLVAFCSFNPLRDYALQELERCARHPHLKGLKLHFGNSGVDVLDAEHVEKVRRVFRAANEYRLPIVAHLWTIGSYGREQAEVFLNQILPEAPDVTVQIAHMAGGGRSTDPALAVYAEAIAAGDPRTKNLYFDVATLVVPNSSDRVLERNAMRMRQIGLDRILWGSDLSTPGELSGQQWRIFRALMPLTPEELRTIASNVAPYLQ